MGQPQKKESTASHIPYYRSNWLCMFCHSVPSPLFIVHELKIKNRLCCTYCRFTDRDEQLYIRSLCETFQSQIIYTGCCEDDNDYIITKPIISPVYNFFTFSFKGDPPIAKLLLKHIEKIQRVVELFSHHIPALIQGAYMKEIFVLHSWFMIERVMESVKHGVDIRNDSLNEISIPI